MDDIKVGDEVVRIDHPNGPEKGIVTAVSGTCISIGGDVFLKRNFAKVIKESIEPTPAESIAHKPLPRQKPVCRIKTPWDPYGEG